MAADARSFILAPGGGRQISLPDRGAQVTLKAVGEQTGGGFSLVESAPAPGAPGLSPHRHRRSDEALYVVEGTVMIRAGEQTVSAAAGSFAFIPRGTVHAFWNAGTARARVLVLFAPAGLEKFLEETEAACSASGGRPQARALDEIRRRHDTELVDTV